MNAQRRSLAHVMRFFPGAVALAVGLFTLAACGGSSQQVTQPLAPVVSLPASLSFGPVGKGVMSGPMTVTLMNTGSASLTFSSNPAVTGANATDFSITAATTCSTANPVVAGMSCAVTVIFTPSTTAGENASLNFADNATPSAQSVALGGTGAVAVPNVQPVIVDLGPPGLTQTDANSLFTDVTICVHGTANCQTIDHIEVDTGSEGLRLISSLVTIAPPQAVDGSGNSLAECVQFADMTYTFGSVAVVDIQMAGEVAASVPIQLIAAPGFTNVPSTCSNGAPSIDNLNSVNALGANGLIGVGEFRQDCGPACASAAQSGTYYSCPNTICSPVAVPALSQLQNPVWMFPLDNNGVLINLPSIAGTAPTLTGSMIFGIGTQTNNALGSAQVYVADPNTGNITTTYNNVSYTGSYLDSGSTGMFFLTATQTNLPNCPNSSIAPGFYCPNSSTPFTAANKGTNMTTGVNVNFSIDNAVNLFNSNGGSNAAFSTLGGPFSPPLEFDFGLSFFFGRTVFTGIEGQTGPGGVVGPYFAY